MSASTLTAHLGLLLLLFVLYLSNARCQLVFAFSLPAVATFSEKPEVTPHHATRSSADQQQQHQQQHRQHSQSRHHHHHEQNGKKKKNRRQDSLNVGRDPLLSLNLNLDAMARANAAERAQELYQRISALHDEGYYAAAPDVVSFNTVLKAHQNDPAKAIEFWESATVSLGESVSRVEPNTRSFNIILLALAKAGLHEEAMDVLRQMQSPESIVIPDRITYNTVLLAFVKANRAAEAELLLQEMIHIGKSSGDDTNSIIHPDVYSFNTVLACWSQQGFPERAQALLDTMKKTAASQEQELTHLLRQALDNDDNDNSRHSNVVRPDVYSYTTVIHAWAKTGNSSRAMELFEEMTSAPYNLRPNKITYTALVQVLCNDGKPEKAQLLVCDMLQRAQSARINNNNEKEDEDDQEQVSEDDFLPDAVLFSILLHGWANVAEERPEQAKRAVLLILKDITTLSKTWPRMAPNSITFTAVFAALAKTRHFDAPEDALQVLRSMHGGGSSSTGGIRPTIVHYNAVLDVYAKSSRADKAVRAAELWKEIEELGKQQQQRQELNAAQSEQGAAAVIPDLITFNTLLACAANSFGDAKLKAQSLEIGLAAFKALRNSSRNTSGVDGERHQSQKNCTSEVCPCQPPSSLTYHYLFKLLRKFMQPPSSKRHTWMKRAFVSCCQEGCLNQLVLDQVLSHITTAEAQELLGSENASVADQSGPLMKVLLEDLPGKWSRNALPCTTTSTQRPSSQNLAPTAREA